MLGSVRCIQTLLLSRCPDLGSCSNVASNRFRADDEETAHVSAVESLRTRFGSLPVRIQLPCCLKNAGQVNPQSVQYKTVLPTTRKVARPVNKRALSVLTRPAS